jgi:hypothetical protein
MYELLLRTETLLLGLSAPVLWGLGLGALVVGLVLWLGGTRYHAAIIGVLGAVVGAVAGLLVSQQVAANPWLSMVVGAAVLGGLSIALRNVLILVLAVLVFSAVGGTGYLAVVLDRAATTAQSPAPTRVGQKPVRQYFRGMDLQARQQYMEGISKEAGTFADRLKALLADTWEATGTHGWLIVVPILAGALVGILLLWLIAKIVIALAYSIVGTATLFLGAQATLLAAGLPAVSDLESRRWLPALTFLILVVVGWVWQLFFAGARKPRPEPHHEAHPSD